MSGKKSMNNSSQAHSRTEYSAELMDSLAAADTLLIHCPELNQTSFTGGSFNTEPLQWLAINSRAAFNTQTSSIEQGGYDAQNNNAAAPEKSQNHWQTSSYQAFTSGLTDTTAKRSVTLILPSHCQLSGSLLIPKAQKRYLPKTLPFLVEEQLSVELETCHISYRAESQAKDLRVYYHAISKQLLAGLIDTFNHSELYLAAIYTEAQWLLAQTPAPAHHLWLLDQQWLICTNTQGCQSQQAVKVTRQSLPLALTDVRAGSADDVIEVHAEQTDLSAEEHQLLAGLVGVTFNPSAGIAADRQTAVIIHSQLQKVASNNMLQGEFKPVTLSHNKTANWRSIAAGLAVFTLLQLLYWLGSGWNFQNEQRHLAEASNSLYREYFPNDKRILNIRRQTLSHLRQGTQSGSQLTPLLGRFSNVWGQHKSVLDIERIRYQRNRDRLFITLTSDSIASLDQLTRDLNSSGLHSRLLSAKEVENEKSNGVFQGSIEITSAQRVSQR